MAYYDAHSNWCSRNPTKRGHFDPLPLGPIRRDQVSRAKDRYDQKVAEQRIRSQYVQLAPGVLVIHERKPWRILAIAEEPLDRWTEEYERAFEADVRRWQEYPHGNRPEKATWRARPIIITLVPDRESSTEPLYLTGPAHRSWPVLPEHYAVCRSCGELPPCPEEVTDGSVQAQMALTDVLMSIPAGHCLGCGEAITPRMKATRFPGPNLWRPDLGVDTAVFHARRECAGDVQRYRKQWLEKGGEDAQRTVPGIPGETA